MLNTYEADGKRYIILPDNSVELFDSWLVAQNLRLAEEKKRTSKPDDRGMKAVIEKEVKWCEEHRGMKSEVYEEAFIAGLKQVLFFLEEIEKAEADNKKR